MFGEWVISAETNGETSIGSENRHRVRMRAARPRFHSCGFLKTNAHCESNQIKLVLDALATEAFSYTYTLYVYVLHPYVDGSWV